MAFTLSKKELAKLRASGQVMTEEQAWREYVRSNPPRINQPCICLEYVVPRGKRWLEQYADNPTGREQADAQAAWCDSKGYATHMYMGTFTPPAIQSFKRAAA